MKTVEFALEINRVCNLWQLITLLLICITYFTASPPSIRPTLALPIRTSTENYDTNFLENQRSTVAIQTSNPRFSGLGSQQSSQATTASALTGGSTPYPFYPDRQGLDPSKFPGSNPNPDNEVKWYYSNYNSENLDPYKDPDPYVDPRIPRDQTEAAKVSPSSSSQTYHCNFSLVIVMLSLPIYMLNV